MPEGDSHTDWFDVAGPSEARPIVFVHGVEITRKLWTPQMTALADEFRLIAVDLPGHGALSAEPFRLDTAVERLARLIDEQAGGKAVVVGFSLGGYVAMELAARYADRLPGLVLAGCTWDLTGAPKLGYRAYARFTQLAGHGLLARLHDTHFRLLFPRRIHEPIRQAGFAVKVIPNVLEELYGRDPRARLSEYPGPVLLLNGAWDLLFRRDERAFLAATQRGRLELIPRAGHLMNLHRPHHFTEAVRRFAGSIDW